MTARILKLVCGVAAVIGLPAAASAQSETSSREIAVIGTVPVLCSVGTLAGHGVFDLGVLIDTTTGFLRTDLSAPARILSGSFCSSRSTINVAASPLSAQNFTATPPAGFARTVNYTATATGWTTTPASFTTGASANAAATQSRASAFTGDITVDIGNFSTAGGSSLRLVADTSYRGLVTVTLAPAS